MIVDTYLVSEDQNALKGFCSYFVNVIGPVRGREATPENEAVGDPDLWYACVRGPVVLSPDNGVQVCDNETGVAVCGVWA